MNLYRSPNPHFVEKKADHSIITLLYDAHTHLPKHENQTLRSSNSSATLPNSTQRKYSIVNGTSPANWSAVLQFARNRLEVLPAIGLHPQQVVEAPADWKATFLQLLAENPTCSIGEIGLDRRYQTDHFEKQLDAFSWQLQQASKQNRPVSIHCVKAIGLLMETLRSDNLPSRGVHLHAYTGPVELIPELVKRGAYFSFAAMQLKSRSTKIPDRIRAIPIDRLLVETDTYYEQNASELINCYVSISEIHGISLNLLAESIEDNFKRYFFTC